MDTGGGSGGFFHTWPTAHSHLLSYLCFIWHGLWHMPGAQEGGEGHGAWWAWKK
jgi:hypothetical protein